MDGVLELELSTWESRMLMLMLVPLLRYFSDFKKSRPESFVC